MTLANALAARLAPRAAFDEAAAETVLAAAVAAARTRWPGVNVDEASFAAWIALRLPTTPAGVVRALEMLNLSELYLACACHAGDPRALAAFDRTFLAGDQRTPEDIVQRTRERLFVRGADGTAPRIALYAGRGGLGPWVAAVMRRMAIDEARATREVPTEDALLAAIGIDPGHGPELDHLKRDARDAVQAALREAVATVAAGDRAMLLAHYIDGVGVVELGARYKLAPSNVSRTLARVRLQLVAQLRRALTRQKNLLGAEVDSLVDLVRSQLTLTGALREPPGAAAPG